MSVKLKPFLKWAGGKTQLLPELLKYVNKSNFDTYYEPFIGGGALFFEVMPKKAVISDSNEDLINCYQMIKYKVDELIEKLREYEYEHSETFYYKVREIDRHPHYKFLSSIEKAGRLIYLNRTCFNGLFRVNSRGEFNVPFGKYKKPLIVNRDLLLAISEYLNANEITIVHNDFETTLQAVKQNDFVYLDPPYTPISQSSSFVGYTMQGFSQTDERRLISSIQRLDNAGCRFLLSNSDSFLIHQPKGYSIDFVNATRRINCLGGERGSVREILISNFKA
jgi:DNA adenine methylase